MLKQEVGGVKVVVNGPMTESVYVAFWTVVVLDIANSGYYVMRRSPDRK